MTTYDENRKADPETAAGSDEADAQLLFTSDNASLFRDRWRDVQGRFVDDPRGAVQAADALVTEVTQSLVKNFAQQKEELESQWSGGGDAETEDLRLALRRYRALFERLLAA